jgi:hypothetical protein
MHIQNNDTTSATSQNYIRLTVKTRRVKTNEHLDLTLYEYQKNVNQYCRYLCPAYLMTQNNYVVLPLQMPVDLTSALPSIQKPMSLSHIKQLTINRPTDVKFILSF